MYENAVHTAAPRPPSLRHTLGIGAVSAMLALAGCEVSTPTTTPSEFESDWPGTLGGPKTPAQNDSDAGSGGVPTDLDGERALVEADIVQVRGDRLYALSRSGGLSIIDASRVNALRLLGKFRSTRGAEPFEMYLRGDVALVMFSSWGQYVADDDENGYRWVQTSKVLALDTSDPANVEQIGSFDVPGAISDSRMVGDVLYVVGYENGYCWQCEQGRPRTSVVSIDVSVDRALRKVDELFFDDDQNVWSWNKRSISVTDQRMYVAGIDYGNDGPVGSKVQVIDISDPAGDLVEGTSFRVEGQVSSRWQLDEHDGVLRVITQAAPWNSSEPPTVETFEVKSSADVKPLGAIQLVLPRPETLQSVRFDGTRAYAITSERTDPLFTIDLSDAAHPKQVGQLEMPGWIYHMEPRGERLLGLGFDPSSAAGAITVSLFDVGDLAAPTMLDRVSFGGDWGYLPEDQDRIHKVFRVLDDQGLILVPYSGYGSKTKTDACGTYGSGVQLVDFGRDALALRGMAPARGEARRALILDGKLVNVSDERVEAFDITDRDAPERTSTVALAQNVSRTVLMDGDTVARISTDWWTNTPSVDFVALKDAERPEAALSTWDLRDVLGDEPCLAYVSIEDAFARHDKLVLSYRRDTWTEATSEAHDGVVVVDVSDPKHPKLASHIDWKTDSSWWRYGGFYSYGLPVEQRTIVHTGDALAMLEATYVAQGERTVVRNRLRVVDLSDLAKLEMTTIDLPSVDGYSGLFVDGDQILTSHYEAVEGSTERVRFYVDRFDLSVPSAPERVASVNVPGALVTYDGSARRAVTMELRRHVLSNVTWNECDERFAHFDFETDAPSGTWNEWRGTCTGYRAILRLVRLGDEGAEIADTFELPEDETLASTSVGDGVLFAVLGRGSWGYYDFEASVDCFGACGTGGGITSPVEILVLGRLRDDAFQIGRLNVDDVSEPWSGFWGTPPVFALDHSALVVGSQDIAVLDARDPTAPSITRTIAGIGNVVGVSVRDRTALLALGTYGVQRIEL